MYKINKLQGYIYCTAQGLWPIFYNNFKQSITYKDFESLCCTSETNIVNQLQPNKKIKIKW